MKPRLKSTPAARELIKCHEPFLAHARQESDGNWIVGHGHRAAAKAGVSVSQEEAELLLVYDVLRAEQAIDESIGGEIGAPQRDALVSFALGIGLTAFRSSAVVRLIRKKRWLDAADAIAAWDGGESARHKAERDLFLKDLPEEASRAPVELVIEFDHPNDDVAVAANAPSQSADTEAEPEQESEVAEAADVPEEEPVAPDAASDDDAKAEPATTALPRDVTPSRSALAERVIMRMRAQLSRPADNVADAEAAPDAATVGDAEADAEFSGPLGFAYTQSRDFDSHANTATEDKQASELPPIVGFAAVNAGGEAGEVAGTRDASEPRDESAEESEDLPDPSEIDPEFSESDEASTGNGWSNGDSRPAPGRNGGHLGEIILLVLGLVLLAGGIWDLSMRAGSGGEQPSLFYGVAALVVGFIFAAGAAIWLFGGRRK
ncbi:lysozyme [Hyphobacterium sp.]|uniref:lysozyme n=1 Tax=Hyphobacterium sp. TaxID=2004662 RepID=UPI003B52D8F8